MYIASFLYCNNYYEVFHCELNKWTPLHYAAMGGHSSVVEVLIRSHADMH